MERARPTLIRRMGKLALLCLVLFSFAAAPAPGDDLRAALLARINRERARSGAPPLRLAAPLAGVAQRHAAEIGRRGSLSLPAEETEATHAELRRTGYAAHEWAENLAVTPDDPDGVIADWKARQRSNFAKLMDPDYRDIGIGLGRLRGTPLYVFLFAVPESEYFARATAGLADLERVRAQVLDRVNRERRAAGRRPLKANAKLDLAAQRHAEDMLARRYFDHQSPAGTTVRERAPAAGYAWRAIGENIAEGQFSVDEVMDTWMHSPGHRHNILDPDFTELGVGVARGESGGEVRVTWVQVFGTPR
jgi:uncharacterized protein YkwD